MVENFSFVTRRDWVEVDEACKKMGKKERKSSVLGVTERYRSDKEENFKITYKIWKVLWTDKNLDKTSKP